MKRGAISAASILIVLGMMLYTTQALAFGFGLHGTLRQRYIRLSDFSVDADAQSHGQPFRNTMRLHLGSDLSFSRNFWIRSKIQLLDGQVLGMDSPIRNGWAGESWQNTRVLSQFQLRESVVQVPIGLGVVRVGRMPVHWALGMVVNGGEKEVYAFDDASIGDIVNGVWAELTPLLIFTQGRAGQAFKVGLGFDLVERDELTRRESGDTALRFSCALTWDEPQLKGSLFLMTRYLETQHQNEMEHFILDAGWYWRLPLFSMYALTIEGEAALATGETRTLSSNGVWHVMDLEQLGAVARFTLVDMAHGINYGLEAGFASGDEEPNDNRDTAFRFDPGFKVGMILFQEIIARRHAASYAKFALHNEDNPALSIYRPDLQPTAGSISNALYIAPKVSVRFCDGCLETDAGGLIAFAADPISAPTEGLVAPAQSPLSGRIAEAGILGYELNVGARLSFSVADLGKVALGTQYGVFQAGPALEQGDLESRLGPIHKWRLLADLIW